MSVISVFVHHCGQNLIDVNIVDVFEEVPDNASLFFAVDAICDWKKWIHFIFHILVLLGRGCEYEIFC